MYQIHIRNMLNQCTAGQSPTVRISNPTRGPARECRPSPPKEQGCTYDVNSSSASSTSQHSNNLYLMSPLTSASHAPRRKRFCLYVLGAAPSSGADQPHHLAAESHHGRHLFDFNFDFALPPPSLPPPPPPARGLSVVEYPHKHRQGTTCRGTTGGK